jgi:hypothetical protein
MDEDELKVARVEVADQEAFYFETCDISKISNTGLNMVIMGLRRLGHGPVRQKLAK